jgi:hypothetical protein
MLVFAAIIFFSGRKHEEKTRQDVSPWPPSQWPILVSGTCVLIPVIRPAFSCQHFCLLCSIEACPYHQAKINAIPTLVGQDRREVVAEPNGG